MKTIVLFGALLFASLWCCSMLSAAPFDTGFILWTQPNGVTFTARCWGDEFEYNFETVDGFRVAKGQNHWYYYAILNSQGDYDSSSARVGIDSPPSPPKLHRSVTCQSSIDQRRASADSAVALAAQWYAQKQAEAGDDPVVLKIGVILAKFSDVEHYKSQPRSQGGTRPDGYYKSDFDSMIFSQNYWNDSSRHPEHERIFGSMRDYFDQMSRGKLILTGGVLNPVDTNGVPIWVTIGGQAAYDRDISPNMMHDALVNYFFHKQEDSLVRVWPDTTGYDKFIIIYAQNDTVEYRITGAWELDNTHIRVPERNGIILFFQNVAFAHMGTYCHEFSHILGIHDEYDTGDDAGTDDYYFDLMGHGNYNGPSKKGECPAVLSPDSRIQKKWISCTQLSGDTTYLKISYHYDNPRIYRIDPAIKTDPSEHYLLETRLRQGFDAYTPGAPDSFSYQPGTLLIWHDSASNGIWHDRRTLKFADNQILGTSQLTTFFPCDSIGNSQNFNDVTIPGATIGISPPASGVPINESPAHIALQGIHRHKPAGQNDSDYTVIDTVYLNREYVSTNQVWNTDVYKFVSFSIPCGVTVTLGPNAHLWLDYNVKMTVDSGAVLKVSPGAFISCTKLASIDIRGSLRCYGTPEHPITFNSSEYSPDAGDWKGISLLGGPDTLNYCTIIDNSCGISIVSSPLKHIITNSSISRSLNYGVFVTNTGSTTRSTVLQSCAIFDCPVGIKLNNARVDLYQTTVQNTTGDTGGVYALNSRIYSEGSTFANNTGPALSVEGSTALLVLSDDTLHPGGNTLHQDGSANGIGEVKVANGGGAYLGERMTYICGQNCGGGGGESTPGKDDNTRRLISTGGGGGGCTPIYCTLDKAGYNNIYNSFSFTGRLVNKLSAGNVMAQLNYWGSCPPDNNGFTGSVDRTNYFCSLQNGEYAAGRRQGGETGNASFASAPVTTTPQPVISGHRDEYLMRHLMKLVQQQPDQSLHALPLLAAMIAPDDVLPDSLSTSWQKFLDKVAKHSSSGAMRSVAAAYMVQAQMELGNDESAILMIDSLLDLQPDDAFWLFCQGQKVNAYIGMGDLTNANAAYQAMSEGAALISPAAVAVLGDALRCADGVRHAGAGGNNQPVDQPPALQQSIDRPTEYALEQNYPNPFNPVTTLRYALPEASRVRLAVYNVLGQEVACLVDEVQAAGYKSVQFDAGNLASGMYFYRLVAGEFHDVKKLIVLK